MTAPTEPIAVLHVTSDVDFAEDFETHVQAADERIVVTTASSKETALNALRDGSFDCIVSAYDLPDADGIALLQAVRRKTESLPFLLFPRDGDESVAAHAIDYEVTGYIPRGPNPPATEFDALAERIIKAVDTVATPAERPVDTSVTADSTNTQALTRELRRYKTILESLDDAVYAIEPDGTIVYVNERYAEMKGVDRTELLGTDIYEWVSEETAEKARAAREAMADGSQEVGVVEYDFLSADGETFPAEMRFTQVATGTNEFDRTGVIRDVTDQKQREESLRRKNEQLEQFASIVSHDLRNPLNVALGRVDIVRQTHDSEHIDTIEQALERIQALIDDLLTLARHGNRVGEKSTLSLPSVVEHAWNAVSTDDAALHVEASQTIEADPGRLQQLFENLFRNSVEHGGSDVSITVGALEAGFYIEDTGPGIPADQRTAVLEMGHTTTDDGTGFGLSIVQQIVAAHDWSIQVTVGTDGGARFEITGVEAA